LDFARGRGEIATNEKFIHDNQFGSACDLAQLNNAETLGGEWRAPVGEIERGDKQDCPACGTANSFGRNLTMCRLLRLSGLAALGAILL
jgi:ribosomal protein S14